jgi:hypothetical protein
LSAIRSTNTSATGLMTSFQSLSFSGGGGISTWGQVLCWYSALVGHYTTMSLVTRCSCVQIYPLLCLFPREEHLFPQAEGRRSWNCSSSIKPTFHVALLLGGYSTSASL